MNRLPAYTALVLLLSAAAAAQTPYSIYFGDIHAHTWYSDGNKDQDTNTWKKPVARSITWARTHRSSFDFLGISDHNHNEGLNMKLGYWRSGFREADSVNQDGVFVGMYAQEWGVINNGGHVLVYGTDKLFGWDAGVYDVYVPKSNYPVLWDSVKKYNGFCYLAHPSQSDYGGIFINPYNAKADSVVRGVALRSGPADSRDSTETDPSGSDYTIRYHDLLRLGYHVAPCGNQDNHYTTFGRANQQRTAVLAASLSKTDVTDALRNRRTYATEDHNLQVRFEVGTHQMGEIFSMSGTVPIRVKAYDPDGENIASIEVRYGVPGSGSPPTTLQSVSNRDSLVFSQSQPAGTTYYYYAYVVESDGHRAWSAPVWITITALPTPAPFAQLSPANTAADQPVAGALLWQQSANALSYDVYLDTSNPPAVLVGSGQTDTTYSYSGLSNSAVYYWKVVARNTYGSTDATGAPWRFTTIVLPPGPFTMLAPADGALDQAVSLQLRWSVSPRAATYRVQLATDSSFTAPGLVLDDSTVADTARTVSGLAFSTPYFWRVSAANAGGTTGYSQSFRFVTVAPPVPVITASAGANGSIVPSGAVSVPYGGSRTFSVLPASGYHVDSLVVDGVKTDSTLSYTFNAVTTDHSIRAVFRINTFILTTSASNGSVSKLPDLARYDSNSTVQLTAVPATGYHFVDWAGDAGGSANPLVLTMNANKSVTANFAINQYALSVTVQGMGTVLKNPDQASYSYHASVQLTALPDTGWHFTGWGGSASGASNPLSVTVDSAMNIRADFSIKTFRIIPASGPHGTILPSDTVLVSYGGSQRFVITPDSGYYVDTLRVDGVVVDSVAGYTFADVTADHFIRVRFQTPSITRVMSLQRDWNLVSLPVIPSDARKKTVFPGASSEAFGYQQGYHACDTLLNGSGYWLKFPLADAVQILGSPVGTDTVHVIAGWNLIGPGSDPVAASSLSSDPPGIPTGSFYWYTTGGYSPADTLFPGRGYWVKAGQAGSLILGAHTPSPAASRIRIQPGSELPPDPPLPAGSTGGFPEGYALEQAYPNPFNPTAVIRYQLPEESSVSLVVYDLLGREVRTLLNGVQDAGVWSVAFDASSLPSGVYVYRMEAAGTSSRDRQFTGVKKILLVK